MKIQKINLVILNFSNSKFNNSIKLLQIKEDLQIKFEQIQIEGYCLDFFLNSFLQLEGKFGCQKFSLDTVNSVLNFLDGKIEEKKENRLVRKTNADNKYLKSRVIEESDNFFITEIKKIYSKADYEVRNVILKENSVRYMDRWGNSLGKNVVPSESHYIGLDNRRICANIPNSIKNFKDKLIYIKEVMENTNKYIKDEKK